METHMGNTDETFSEGLHDLYPFSIRQRGAYSEIIRQSDKKLESDIDCVLFCENDNLTRPPNVGKRRIDIQFPSTANPCYEMV
jgi:hypothetical protein